MKEKCVPEGHEKGKGQKQQKGQTKGPIGKPKGVKEMDTIKEAMDLVDVILTGDYGTHKKIQEADDAADNVLDEVENKLENEPDEDLAQLHQDVVDELTKDEVTPLEETIAVSISRLIREEDYREFFKKMMKKHGVSNPSELDGEKKKAFFNTVDREWKAKKETD